MTVKEIQQRAQMEVSSFISLPMAIALVNEVSILLCTRYDSAAPTETRKYEVEAYKEYELPDECIGVKKVTKDGEPYKNYKVIDNFISFSNSGTYDVIIQVTPMEVENGEDEPDINEAYHPILYKYLAAKATRPVDREIEAEFYRLADEINIRISRKKRKGMRMPARVWR